MEELTRLRRATELAGVCLWRVVVATGALECTSAERKQYGLESEGRLADELRRRVQLETNAPGLFSFDTLLTRDEGSVRALTVRGEPELGPGGELVAYVGVVIDVTARHHTELLERRELALHKAAVNRIEMLARNLPGAAYQCQLFPDGRSSIPWANAGMRTIFGLSPETLKEDATPVFARIHAEDRPKVDASIARSARNLSEWKSEFRVTDDDGSVRWLTGHATPERLDDGSTLWHGYTFDVTDRKHFEQALVAAREEALEASRVKSQFLANMSHEIRTPLNGILGMTQLLLDASPREDQRRFLEATRISGQTLLELINDILDLSKVESGRMELERVPFAPRELLAQLEQLISPRAKEKQLPVRWQVDESVPLRLLGDPTRLGQVLLNLVGNAVKFTERGEVVLHATWTPGPGLQISVRDTGIGIGATQLPTLFELFTQGDGSITRRYGGTGLGLAISRKLVECMGGRLTVVSTEGVGSTFSVTAPLPSASTISSRGTVEHSSRRLEQPLRILVAEDNAINALVVRTMLERDGHSVDHVMTGAAAVQATAAQEYDLVLMDMQMPELDGLEATRQIRTRETFSGQHVLICALTANAMKGDTERCHQAGMDDYLTKPVELSALRRKLAAAAAVNTPTFRRASP